MRSQTADEDILLQTDITTVARAVAVAEALFDSVVLEVFIEQGRVESVRFTPPGIEALG